MPQLGPATKLIGWIAYKFSLIQPVLPVFGALLLGALYPIYTGSHASLSRPSSAAERKETKSSEGFPTEEEDENVDKENSTNSKKTGLEPADALWFPLMGGFFLGGLYILIKWMEDTTFLNKILNWWFSLLGVGTVGTLLADSLSVLKSILFPQRWSDGSTLWHGRSGDDKYVALSSSVSQTDGHPLTRSSPFPGWTSHIPLPAFFRRRIWSLRKTLASRYQLLVFVHGEKVLKAVFGVSDLIGHTVSLIIAVVYSFVGQPWWLMNVFAFGSSYTLIQIITPKTFWTGTVVLSGLFFYDIYMAFFTPLMATVAKSLDVPIKLVIPRSGTRGGETVMSFAVLGLGDVVLPGMIIALALRFDLYMFYLRKQSKRRSLKTTVSEDENDHISERPLEIVKAPYRSATGRWGERLWTRLGYAGRSPSQDEPAAFPKPYFYATLIGYVIGMFVTFGVLAFSKHAQPALLYLVPGVLIPAWGLAYFRGEIKDFWQYSEDIDEEKDTAATRASTSTESKPPKSEDASGKKKDDSSHLETSASGSWKVERLFAVSLTVRRPYPPTNQQSKSPNISPSIVTEIRKALDEDMDLRSSGSISPNSSHAITHRHHHLGNSVGDGSPAEKRVRLE